MRKAVAMTLIAFGVGICVLVGILIGPVRSAFAVEEPAYRVVQSGDEYEIRVYEPMILAEVHMTGDHQGSLNSGFGILADYIFGNNTDRASIEMTSPVMRQEASSSRKIAMTAPVMSRESEDAGMSENTEGHVITFVMPAEFTMETLPKPNNDRVVIREAPAKRYAVVRFSGHAREGLVEEKQGALIAALQQDGLVWTGMPILAQYNPPWTPGPMRRNEIMLELESDENDTKK